MVSKHGRCERRKHRAIFAPVTSIALVQFYIAMSRDSGFGIPFVFNRQDTGGRCMVDGPDISFQALQKKAGAFEAFRRAKSISSLIGKLSVFVDTRLLQLQC